MRLSVLTLAGLLSFGGAAAMEGARYESFEAGYGAWSVDHDVICYRSEDPCTWSWSADRVPGAGVDGAWGILIAQDGVHDSGTVWVEREIAVPAGERVEVAFWVFSPFLAPTTAWGVRGYAGESDPEREEEFFAVGALDDLAGWRRYCFAVPAPQSETMWVAAGPRVAWEGPRVHALDFVSVRGATGGEPCGLLDDVCHVAGAACAVPRATCEVAACPQRS